MKVVEYTPGTFHLEAETTDDSQLLDALDMHRFAVCSTVARLPGSIPASYTTHTAVLRTGADHADWLLLNTERQIGRRIRELLCLCAREPGNYAHIGALATNPQAQEEFAALAVQLKLVLHAFCQGVGSDQLRVDEVQRSHGVVPPVGNIVQQQGGAA